MDPASSQSPLFSVWGSSLSNVFATGNDDTIIHYNGNGWSNMTSGTTNNLLGIWAVLPLMSSPWVIKALSCITMESRGAI